MALRLVVDTNTIVSGLLWHGPPRQLLQAAREGKLELFTSAVLLAELEDVLQREKFAGQLARAGIDAHELVLGYAALARVVVPAELAPIIESDPDDDAVLACADAASAELIVSGDRHLLKLKTFRGIRIVSATEALSLLPK